ncbi:Autophagy protein 16 [Golovinomyces cichoracearum]|uniref:Autophagy protein 16 n=1 Tax=Golovinomyces cichoracearum TaxID=62708 RepID=A0A420J2D9_9PEZI|nr:Autophagy protein 16 [Golovinomyces cichoracearum]
MTVWRDEYLKELKECDRKRKNGYSRIDDQLIDIFTTLLDQVAVLKARKSGVVETISEIQQKDLASPGPNREISLIRSGLAEAIRSKGQLQSRVNTAETELVRLREKNKINTDTIEGFSRERVILLQKLKDRDEELLGKTKLLDDVYDEVVSLNLQLNMSEQKLKDLRAENQFLVDRWMARQIHEWELNRNGPMSDM